MYFDDNILSLFQREIPKFITQGRKSPFALWNARSRDQLVGFPDPLIRSRLQPGNEGECVSMVLLAGTIPSWFSLPCNHRWGRGYVCKRRAETAQVPVPSHETSDVNYGKCGSPEIYAIDGCYLLHQANPIVPFKITFISPDVKEYLIRLFSFLNTVTSVDYQLQLVTRSDVEFIKHHDIPCTSITSYASHANGYTMQEIKLARCLHKNTTKTYYVLRGVRPKNTCEFNQVICGETCISPMYLCCDRFSSSSAICACSAKGQLIYDKSYCNYVCPPQNCSCPQHHFQCGSGGCIQFTFICDGKADCIDASDEICGQRFWFTSERKNRQRAKLWINHYFCMGYLCMSGECIPLKYVNDLMPDCPGGQAEDEQLFINMLHRGESFQCTHINHHPCVAGLSVCFPLDKFCLFDSDDEQNHLWCRDGAHLGDCAQINCTNSYKCTESYCIPFHRVCNGRYDCIHGEDEERCDEYICKGLLRCQRSRICVHPHQICDGTSHCPKADDENYCDLKPCDRNCTCIAYSSICTGILNRPLPQLPTKYMKLLEVTRSYIPNPDFKNICDQKEITYLNMSDDSIQDICGPLCHNCAFYDKVILLDLSRNVIKDLRPSCFRKLSSLKILRLANNPVQFIENAFMGLSLEFLSIKQALVTEISAKTFNGMSQIRTLDLSHIYLHSLDGCQADILSHIPDLIVNDPRLCCVFPHANACQEMIHFCPRILPYHDMGYLVFFVGCVSVFINVTSLFVNAKYSKESLYAKTISCLLFINILLGMYISIIGAADMYYGQHFVLAYNTWRESILCRLMKVVSSTALVLNLFMYGLLMFITVETITRIKFYFDKRKIICGLLLLVAVVSALIIMQMFLKVNGQGQSGMSGRLCNNLVGPTRKAFADNLLEASVCLVMISLFLYVLGGGMKVIIHINKTTKEIHKFLAMEIITSNARKRALCKTMVEIVLLMSFITLPYPLLKVISLWNTAIPEIMYISIIFSTIILGILYVPLALVYKPLFHRYYK